MRIKARLAYRTGVRTGASLLHLLARVSRNKIFELLLVCFIFIISLEWKTALKWTHLQHVSSKFPDHREDCF